MPSILWRIIFLFWILVTVLVLCSAATLDAEERQKEEKARESARVVVRGGAAAGAPYPPEDLMVDPQVDAAVLTWSPPSDTTDLDHYSVYVEGEDMEDETDKTYYYWTNLDDCTSYTFGVRSVSAAGSMSDPVTGKGETLEGIPPAPQNLQVDSFTATTVTLTWDEPDTLCYVDYRVKWSDDGITTKYLVTNETNCTVTDLSADTSYTFDVSAFTSFGEGDPASVEQNTTAHDGGPPVDLKAVGISASVISVSWSEPTLPPNYYTLKAPPCTFSEEIVIDQSYNITGLDPCESCGITVTSVYIDDGFLYEAYISGSSQGGAAPPPKNCAVQATLGAVTVSWDRPDTSCFLGPYSVNWTETKLWGDGGETSDSDIVPGEKLNVLNPVPYSQYSFIVKASIEGVFGNPASCSGTSLETLPGVPVILAVESTGHGEALVNWEAPIEENGVIKNYGIFVDSGTNPAVQVAGDVFSATVELEPCKSYSISMKAENGAGWGPLSEAKDVFVGDDVLPDEVNCTSADRRMEVCWLPYSESCPVSSYNLEWEGDVLWSDDLVDSSSTSMNWTNTEICYNISALPYTKYHVTLTVGSKTETRTCSGVTPMAAPGPPASVNLATSDLTVYVAWTEPEQKNGIIDNYKVEWKDSSGYVDFNTTEDNSTFSFEFTEPSCGMTVNVTVRAKVEDVDYFGESSPPQTAFLVNSVKNLTCETSGPGEVSLNWTFVNEECPVGFTNLTWTYDSLWSDDTGGGSQVVEDSTSFTVKSLPPYSLVSFQVHVDNNPEYTECTDTTPEEKSSAPTDLEQIANATSFVTIQWGLPTNLNGELTGWRVRWEKLGGASPNEDELEPEQMTFNISGLSASSTYSVDVMALNGAGVGEADRINATTAPSYSKPSPTNTNLIIGLSVGGGLLLIILLVGGFILYSKKGSSKPPRSAPHMPEVADADSDELYKMQHVSSANQRFQNKLGSVDFGTNSELYSSPRPSLPKDDIDDDGGNDNDGQVTTGDDKGPMFGAPADRRYSQQLSSNLPRLGAYNRRPSQQVNSRMRNFEEYNRRLSQQDLIGRPSLSGGPGRPNLGEYGRRPSQQIDLGRPKLREYGRRPSQQINLGGPILNEHGRRPSQQAELGKPRLGEYGRRPSQQIELSRPNLAEYGRRPSQQIDIGRPKLAEYGRRPSQQIDIGSSVPTGAGSYPSRPPQQELPRRFSADLYSRRPSQQADIGRPGSRMLMKRPSQQFVMKFEEIEEL